MCAIRRNPPFSSGVQGHPRRAEQPNNSSSGTTTANLTQAHIHTSRNACVPPFQLATPAFPLFNLRHPRDSNRPHPEGKPCTTYVQNALFFAYRQPFLSGRGSSLALSAARHSGPAGLYTTRKTWPGPVARALGVQSRGELALFAGSLSAEPEPTRPGSPWKPPKCHFFVLRSAAVYQYLLRTSTTPALTHLIILRHSHGTTAAALQAFPCDNHERCFCLCVSCLLYTSPSPRD